MSADYEGDSHMLSSSESSPEVETPQKQVTVDPTTLSPPASQARGSMSSGATTTTAFGANSNGKRPLNTISNEIDDEREELDTMANNTKQRQDFPTKTHNRSGYTWSRSEDEPGFSWLNGKAQDEAARAWETLVHKEAMVKNRYGDIFDMVEKEKTQALTGGKSG
jgi:hypothetical protein